MKVLKYFLIFQRWFETQLFQRNLLASLPFWSDFHFHTGDKTLWKSSHLVQGYQMDEACCSKDCKSWELFITFWSLRSTSFLEFHPLLCIVHFYIFVHITARRNTSFTQLSVLPDFELLNGQEHVLLKNIYIQLNKQSSYKFLNLSLPISSTMNFIHLRNNCYDNGDTDLRVQPLL